MRPWGLGIGDLFAVGKDARIANVQSQSTTVCWWRPDGSGRKDVELTMECRPLRRNRHLDSVNRDLGIAYANLY